MLDDLHALANQGDCLAELKRMMRLHSSRKFKKGHIIFNEGDTAQGLYLVTSGRIKTIKLDEGGRELMTGMYVPDDYLGVKAFLANGRYADTATTLEDSTLCFISKDVLEPLFNKQPDLFRSMIKLLTNDIEEKEDQLMHLAYHSVRKRKAESLLKLFKQQASENMGFEMTREDLAAMAAVATETVSRTLSDFRDEKLIEKQGSMIFILDAKRRAKMKN
ncbi:Crp/Fnr family transcriptional regulator [Mucilaginibacter paludis]|uniref:Crp/Fnr family transcriptional regulator n=1 Tax=Mucilaginibacter paludis TaxID=423351 RepID=UPI0001E9D4CD|nr:Crp/Fnr family transcriptional regulator [Mucilaginibacter paludis]